MMDEMDSVSDGMESLDINERSDSMVAGPNRLLEAARRVML